MAAGIVTGVAQERDRLTLSLEPVELGRVEVALHVDGAGRLHAAFAVERPETLHLLQRDARGLEQALAGNGLQLADAGLSFDLRRDGGQGGNGFAELPRPSTGDVGDAARPGSAAATPVPRPGLMRLLDLSV